jgi:hypothetical protein
MYIDHRKAQIPTLSDQNLAKSDSCRDLPATAAEPILSNNNIRTEPRNYNRGGISVAVTKEVTTVTLLLFLKLPQDPYHAM